MIVEQITGWKIRVIICLALSTIFLCSCSMFGGIAAKAMKKPEAEFTKGILTGLSFDTADFLFDLKIKNPNHLGLKLVGLSYEFSLNKNTFLTGKQNKNLEIKAGSESIIQLPISLNYVKLYKTFKSLINEDKSKYQIKCVISFDVPILGAVSIPLSMKGDFPLPKFPIVALVGLKLKKLTLAGAEVQLDIKLKNPNAFSMMLKRFHYQFDVNGLNWVSARIEEATTLRKKGESVIEIPIKLNFRKVGQSVSRIFIEDKGLNYRLKTRLDLAIKLPLMKQVSIPFESSGSIKLIK